MASTPRSQKESNPSAPPFDHPVRRRILRRLHANSGVRSANDLSSELGLELTTIAYHVKVLTSWRKAEALDEEDAAGARRIESKVAQNPRVLAFLDSTKAEDEAS
jgi:DNA-binding transcriptional ArsR family regulator